MARPLHRASPASSPFPGPDNNGYTRCCNLPILGACADAAMLALAHVDDRLFDAGIDDGPVAWLHDEIVLEVHADQAERAASILKQSMIDGFAETFPGAPLTGLATGALWQFPTARRLSKRLEPRLGRPRLTRTAQVGYRKRPERFAVD